MEQKMKSFIKKCIIIVELHERMKDACSKVFYKNIKSFDQIEIQGEDIYYQEIII
jgi:hypothetical protein